MKRALITGIAGQDGYHLAKYLHETHGYEIFGIGQNLHPDDERILKDLPFVTVMAGNLSDYHSLLHACERASPDEVYNLGAISSVDLSFAQAESIVDINATGVVRLLNAVRRVQEEQAKEVRLYQASSSEMFGATDHLPCDEAATFRPCSPYAAAKAFGHHMVGVYRNAYDVYAASGICFNHESPRRGTQFVSRRITRAAARIKYGLQAQLQLGDPEARRDWGYAGDYVIAMWAMLQKSSPDDFVVATGRSHSVKEFATLAFEYAGISDKIDHISWNSPSRMRPLEVSELVGDASKARLELGWKSDTSFEQLVSLMVEADLRAIRDIEL